MDDDQKITYFGESNFRNQKVRFGIKKNDRRKHVYVIGKTGMGKTTLLENMAIQDIQSGEGIAFIDPHGDTAEKLLDFVPKERINDVIYFNPADTNFPIGLNVLENVDPERRHLVADGLMGVFKKIWQDVWSARMEYILNNTILALLEYPNATMLGINQVLVNKEYRKKVVDCVKDPIIKAFWTQEFAKYTDKYAAEATPAIQNKVGQFISNPLIRNIIGQYRSSFDFRKAMDQKKIIIVNLSKGRVGEDNSRLLGAMFVTKLYLAAMSRVDVPESNRSDFFLYVDEFQNFASESFASILSEARKYKLSLILAHQYITQMEEEVSDAVFGNIGTTVAFRVGAEDAEVLEKEFAPSFIVEDIVNLPFASIYLKLMIDGVASHPFSAATLPPIQIQEGAGGFKDEIIDASRKNYGTPRKEVDEQIAKWTEELGGDSPAEFKKKPADFRIDAKPSVNLYDAVCAACGKKTQVPFEPDPSRPVFCQEHIGLAGKFNDAVKSFAGKRPTPSREFTKPVRREFTERPREDSRPPQPVGVFRGPVVPRRDSEEKYISLKDLQSKSRPALGFRRERDTQQKNENLQALREALKKSLSRREVGIPTSDPKDLNSASGETKKEDVVVEKQITVNESNKGTLKPGDHIEL